MRTVNWSVVRMVTVQSRSVFGREFSLKKKYRQIVLAQVGETHVHFENKLDLSKILGMSGIHVLPDIRILEVWVTRTYGRGTMSLIFIYKLSLPFLNSATVRLNIE